MRNISLEKSYTKYGGKTSLRPFFKKLKLSNSLNNSLKFYTVCFYCMQSYGLSKYIKTKLQITWFYPVKSFYEKQKKVCS